MKNADSRRDFLKRVLRTGAYAAPMLVAMSMKSVAAQQPSSPGSMGMMTGAGMGNSGNMP